MNNPATATICANGRPETVRLPCTLSEYLLAHGLDPRLVAVEHNGTVVLRSAYPSTELRDGDQLEIVKVVAGG